MRNGIKLITIYLTMLIFLSGFAPFHQDTPDTSPLTLSVMAGYDGLFRENQWFPLLIQAGNDGPDRNGHLVVRPETSGNAFNNTFSTPLDLPTGSRKTVFLYVTAQIYASEVRVEFIAEDGEVLIAETSPLQSVREENQLQIIITSTTSQTPNLSQVAASGFSATQSIWRLENIPDSVEPLRAVDRIMFHDIDTGALSLGQQDALRHWVLQGGHLIITGGSNWQAVNAGLQPLLPLATNNSEILTDFDNLAHFVNDSQNDLRGETTVATGVLHPDAQVLVQTDDGIPLIARRSLGLGTVDYLTMNPVTSTLQGWPGIHALWHKLASNTNSRPAWGRTDADFITLAMATEIIPGYDILPDGLNMLMFLTLYILLIGPLNYYILNRLNRRELAWFTIPLFILAFSGLAWFSGFNLRGNEVLFNRLALVQSWVDDDEAFMNGMLGVLSPRRNNYSFSLTDGAYLNTVRANTQSGFLGSNSNITIAQDINFSANDFPIDASYVATFNVQNTIPKPALSGQATLFYDQLQRAWIARGTVRNDTEYPLDNALILARGAVFLLETSLEPGQIQSFEMALDNSDAPANASPLERSSANHGWQSSYYWYNQQERSTLLDILGPQNIYYGPSGSHEIELLRQKRMFLNGLLRDQYAADGRGDKVYLLGWTDTTPFQVDFESDNWQANDLSLYVVQLDVEHEIPSGQVTISPHQFTWVAVERSQQSNYSSPTEMSFLAQDSLTVRFTPIQSAVLSNVDEINVILNVATTLRKPTLEIWNWQTTQWEILERPAENDTQSMYRVRNPENYLDHQNSVEVRITNDLNVSINLVRLAIEQRGNF